MDVNTHIFLDRGDIITVEPQESTIDASWQVWVGFKTRPFALLSGVHMSEEQARDLYAKLGHQLEGLEHDRAEGVTPA